MQEITEENELGLQVFINGTPKLDNMPQCERESFIAVLEREISDYLLKIDNVDTKHFLQYNKSVV